MARSTTTPLLLPGPAGDLEALLTASEAGNGCAVLCHPHPGYGGSMHDAVLSRLEQALLGAGHGSLRFNFRGVGASAGRYDGQGGEVEDLLAVVRWLGASEHGPLSALGGYSFGASIVWQALGTAEVPHAYLIAPPTAMMPFNAGNVPCAVDVFYGELDDYVDPSVFKGQAGIRQHPLAGADHFFSGAFGELDAALSGAVRAPS